MRYGVRTALLNSAILVLILALFSILGCGSGSVSRTGEQAQAEQVEPVEPVEPVTQGDNAVTEALPSFVPVDSSKVRPDPSGAAAVAVPTVIGMSFEEASTTLSGLGFQVSSGQDYSERTAAGAICDQDPSAGSAASPGSPVFIVVSQGTAWVTCSSCRGTGTVSEQYTCPECGGSGWCYS